jgi:hypothetical protein
MNGCPGVLLVVTAWLLLTPPWKGNDDSGCAMPESDRPYAEWTRDVVDYPTEAACRDAKENQTEAVEFQWRGFHCLTRLSDSRVCVPADKLGPNLPPKEYPPEKVDRVKVK